MKTLLSAALVVSGAACSLVLDPGSYSEGANEGCPNDECFDAGKRTDSAGNAPDEKGTEQPPESQEDSGAPPDDPDANAPPPLFVSCAAISPAPTLCADFDGASFSQGFVVQAPLGKLGADTTLARTAPKSLFSVVSKDETANPYAYLEQNYAGNRSDIRLAFDMYVDKFVAGKQSTPFILRLAPDTDKRHSLTIPWTSTGNKLQEAYVSTTGQATYQFHDLPAGSLVPGKWTRIDIRLVVSGTPKVSLLLDGQSVLKDVALKAPGWTAAPVELVVGLAYVESTSTEWRIRYDNLVLDVK